MAKYYIADLHFYHKGIIRFDDRPFNTVEEMNKAMLGRYNSVVRNNDEVYIVGDVFLGGTVEENEGILKKLKGKKHLIVGNHDSRVVKGKLSNYFETVSYYKEVDDYIGGFTKKVILCHYPIPTFNGHFRDDTIHLYGHVHQTFEENLTFLAMVMNKFREEDIGNMLNIGAMLPYMKYFPRTLEELLVEVENQKKLREEFYKQHEQEILHLINETYNKKLVK